MDDAAGLSRQLIRGDVTYPDLFDRLIQREPRFSSVELADIKRVDPSEVPRPSEGIVRDLVFGRLVGLSANDAVKRWVKRLDPVRRREQQERRILVASVWHYGNSLVGEKSSATDDLLRLPFAASLASLFLLRKFGLLNALPEVAAELRERLYGGETTYSEIFLLVAEREPRIDVHSVTALKEVAASLPLVHGARTRRGNAAVERDAFHNMSDSMLLALVVTQLTGRTSGSSDPLVRSSFATTICHSYLGARLDISFSAKHDDEPETGD